jgi:hypothetical protein
MAQDHLFERTTNFIVLVFLMAVFLTEIICKRAVLPTSGLFIEFTKINFTNFPETCPLIIFKIIFKDFTNGVMVYRWTGRQGYSEGDSEYGDVLSSLRVSGHRLCLSKDSAELLCFSSFIECNSENICQKITCLKQTL